MSEEHIEPIYVPCIEGKTLKGTGEFSSDFEQIEGGPIHKVGCPLCQSQTFQVYVVKGDYSTWIECECGYQDEIHSG